MGRQERSKISGDVGSNVIPRFKWLMFSYMTIVHLLALWGLWLFVSDFRIGSLCVLVLTYWLSGLGITCGAHRLWSHRSFKAKDPLRFFLVLCNSMANQGSVFHWSRDHRVHHRHSETSADPHDATQGMFFAHMGWLFWDKKREVVDAGTAVGMQDLADDWIVAWQDRNKQWLMPLLCFIVPASMSTLVGDSYWRGLFIAGTLRYVMVLHSTWFVNSFAHWYGDRPYNPNINPAENFFVTLCTGGEGWHNYHHTYPSDYSASEFGWNSQFNFTTLFIDTMAFIGQAYDRKKSKAKSAAMRERDDNDHVSLQKKE